MTFYFHQCYQSFACLISIKEMSTKFLSFAFFLSFATILPLRNLFRSLDLCMIALKCSLVLFQISFMQFYKDSLFNLQKSDSPVTTTREFWKLRWQNYVYHWTFFWVFDASSVYKQTFEFITASKLWHTNTFHTHTKFIQCYNSIIAWGT